MNSKLLKELEAKKAEYWKQEAKIESQRGTVKTYHDLYKKEVKILWNMQKENNKRRLEILNGVK